MGKIRYAALRSALVLFFVLMTAGWAMAQTDQGGAMMGSQKGAMMHEQKMMGGKCGMGAVGGMGGHGGAMMQEGMGHQGMQGAMLMHGYHAWLRRLMHHADEVGLSGEQLEKLDQMITAHQVHSVRKQAEIQAGAINLKKDLRAAQIDLKSVEKQLQGLHGKSVELELDGIRLYTDVLGLLSDQQREKMQEVIGNPFPAAWEQGRHSRNCPAAEKEEPAQEAPKSPAGHDHS